MFRYRSRILSHLSHNEKSFPLTKLKLFSRNYIIFLHFFFRFIQKETIEILIPTDEMAVVDHLLDVEMEIAHLIGY